MSQHPREVTDIHTRLSRCALEIEDARAYWRQCDGSRPVDPIHAFETYWFGARSLPRVKVLLINMRARFKTFPNALRLLHRWPHMSTETRRLICHWHLMLTDPLYRNFAVWLAERYDRGRDQGQAEGE